MDVQSWGFDNPAQFSSKSKVQVSSLESTGRIIKATKLHRKINHQERTKNLGKARYRNELNLLSVVVMLVWIDIL